MDAVRAQVGRIFDLEHFVLKYKDSDGDLVTMTNDEELGGAISHCGTSVRLVVTASNSSVPGVTATAPEAAEPVFDRTAWLQEHVDFSSYAPSSTGPEDRAGLVQLLVDLGVKLPHLLARGMVTEEAVDTLPNAMWAERVKRKAKMLRENPEKGWKGWKKGCKRGVCHGGGWKQWKRAQAQAMRDSVWGFGTEVGLGVESTMHALGGAGWRGQFHGGRGRGCGRGRGVRGRGGMHGPHGPHHGPHPHGPAMGPRSEDERRAAALASADEFLAGRFEREFAELQAMGMVAEFGAVRCARKLVKHDGDMERVVGVFMADK